MKHSLKITLVLLTIFLLAQYIGIGVVYSYIDHTAAETTFTDLPIGERIQVEESTSYVWVMAAILIGTALALLLAKYRLGLLWKLWFFIAIAVTLVVAFAPFMPLMAATILSIILAGWKTLKPNFYIHNLTELFIYGGLAAIFVPLFNLWSVSILMVLIALYDAYAVWKSKHMVTLAKSQAKAKVFAGLLIPYSLGKPTKKVPKGSIKVKKVRTAILGGGDIGFPLIFAGVVLKELGLWQSLIIPLFALAGLTYLFWKADEKKFYPAMPYIGVGCFVGLAVVWLISLV